MEYQMPFLHHLQHCACCSCVFSKSILLFSLRPTFTSEGNQLFHMSVEQLVWNSLTVSMTLLSFTVLKNSELILPFITFLNISLFSSQTTMTWQWQWLFCFLRIVTYIQLIFFFTFTSSQLNFFIEQLLLWIIFQSLSNGAIFVM